MNFETTSTSFEQPPVGAHVAKLVRIIDLGTQESEYNGDKTVRRQSIFTWELPFETREDGQPYIISKFYTQSLGEKANLTKDLTSWLGKAPPAPKTKEENKNFTKDNIKPLLGKGCQIVVSERDNGKRQVSAVVGLAKGTNLADGTHNPLVFFDLDAYDENTFEELSDGIKKMIAKSPEYAKIMNGGDEPVDNSDIPF